MAATASGRLLAPSLAAVFKSVFWNSSPIARIGLLAIVDAVGSSTWRAGTAAL
jgi:hypothetical protein